MYVSMALGFDEGLLKDPMSLYFEKAKNISRRINEKGGYIFENPACALTTLDKLVYSVEGVELMGAFADMDVAFVGEEALKRGFKVRVAKDCSFYSPEYNGSGLAEDMRYACDELGIEAAIWQDDNHYYFNPIKESKK